MAKQTGISVGSVQRIWCTHGLHPHRVRQFKLSNDPNFADKLRDAVGLHVDPPAPPMPSCCRLTRRAGSRRSTAPSPACP